MNSELRTPNSELWEQPFPDSLLTDPELPRLAERLAAEGYDEAGLAAELEFDPRLPLEPQVRELAALRLAARATPRSRLIRLFFLEQPVAPAELSNALGSAWLHRLLGWGLLAAGSRGGGPSSGSRDAGLRSTVAIRPCGGRLWLSDPEWLGPTAPVGVGGPVMAPGLDTQLLAQVTPRRTARRILDLCTGPGVHALLAAAPEREVVGLDRSTRALAFARLNAAWQRVTDVTWQLGDATRAVEQVGGGWDLVLCNPPFVATLVPGAILYRDGGGPLGDEVLRAVLRQLPALLAEGGEARLVADLLFCQDAVEPEVRLAQLLGPGGLPGCDLLLVEDQPYELVGYARVHATRLRQERLSWDPADWLRLLDHYREQGVVRAARVIVAVRKVAGSAGRHRCRTSRDLLRLEDRHIRRLFGHWDAWRREEAPLQLLEQVARPVAGWLVRRAPLGNSGGSPTEHVEFPPESPWFKTGLEPRLVQLLTACDGTRTGRELTIQLAHTLGIAEATALELVVHGLQQLAEHELVELVG